MRTGIKSIIKNDMDLTGDFAGVVRKEKNISCLTYYLVQNQVLTKQL